MVGRRAPSLRAPEQLPCGQPPSKEAAQPSNVDTVMVDGRILKRRGRLTAVDVEQVVSEASSALSGVRKRAGWW